MLVGSPKYNIGDLAVAIGDSSRANTPVIQNTISPLLIVQNPAFAFPNAVKQGNVLFCIVSPPNSSAAATQVTDTLNSSWQLIGQLQNAGFNRGMFVFEAVAPSDGLNTVTVLTSASAAWHVGLMEIDGSQYLSTLDGPVLLQVGATATGNPLLSPLFTTTQGNDLIIAAGRSGSTLPNYITGLPASWYGFINFHQSDAYTVDPASVGGGTFRASWAVSVGSNWISSIWGLKINPYKPPIPPGPKPKVKQRDGWPGGWPGGGC